MSPVAAPEVGPRTSSGRARRLLAARTSQGGVRATGRPSHCLGRSIQSPPKPLIPPRLIIYGSRRPRAWAQGSAGLQSSAGAAWPRSAALETPPRRRLKSQNSTPLAWQILPQRAHEDDHLAEAEQIEAAAAAAAAARQRLRKSTRPLLRQCAPTATWWLQWPPEEVEGPDSGPAEENGACGRPVAQLQLRPRRGVVRSGRETALCTPERPDPSGPYEPPAWLHPGVAGRLCRVLKPLGKCAQKSSAQKADLAAPLLRQCAYFGPAFPPRRPADADEEVSMKASTSVAMDTHDIAMTGFL